MVCTGQNPNRAIPLSFHRDVFLFLKETLHNIRRHARARNVSVEIAWKPESLLLSIEDDGLGFDVHAEFEGSGLANMRHRAEALGATFHLDSTRGKGTRVQLNAPIP